MISPFLGFGTGRCGTSSLFKIIDECENTVVGHESRSFITNWDNPDLQKVDALVDHLMDHSRTGVVAGEISLTLLPRLDYITSKLPEVKLICLHRRREEVVASFLRKCGGLSRVLPEHKCHELERSVKFPTIAASDAIHSWELYWMMYENWSYKFDHVFHLNTEDLNNPERIEGLLNHLSVPLQNRQDRRFKATWINRGKLLGDITICIAVKNRSDVLLRLIASVKQCDDNDKLRLSVFDCGSNDVDDLHSKIERAWNKRSGLTFASEPMVFNKSTVVNNAVRQARTENVFLCDADMLFPKNHVWQYYYRVWNGRAWFPICFNLGKERPTRMSAENGDWRLAGTGNVGITKTDFNRIGGLDERFTSYGGEDMDLYNRACSKIQVIRDKYPEFYHIEHDRDTEWHRGRV